MQGKEERGEEKNQFGDTHVHNWDRGCFGRHEIFDMSNIIKRKKERKKEKNARK
jgi:hypothetical protein